MRLQELGLLTINPRSDGWSISRTAAPRGSTWPGERGWGLGSKIRRRGAEIPTPSGGRQEDRGLLGSGASSEVPDEADEAHRDRFVKGLQDTRVP